MKHGSKSGSSCGGPTSAAAGDRIEPNLWAALPIQGDGGGLQAVAVEAATAGRGHRRHRHQRRPGRRPGRLMGAFTSNALPPPPNASAGLSPEAMASLKQAQVCFCSWKLLLFQFFTSLLKLVYIKMYILAVSSVYKRCSLINFDANG